MITKVLKIIKSQQLPSVAERDVNTIYFVYDKLQIYLGRNKYINQYAIVEEVPNDPAVGMLYILFNGEVKSYIHTNVDLTDWYNNYTGFSQVDELMDVGHIASVICGTDEARLALTTEYIKKGEIVKVTSTGKFYEVVDEDLLGTEEAFVEDHQVDILREVGTTFFMNAEYRYLDLQTRVIELPYQNGNYQLSVNAAANLKINENTIVRYNPSKGEFEIIGNLETDDARDYLSKLGAVDTDTIKASIENGDLKSEVKISQEYGNLIKVFGDGLYATLEDVVNSADFELLLNTYYTYRTTLSNTINDLRNKMEEYKYNTIDEATIGGKILEALENYKPTIEELFANYDAIYNQLGYIRNATINYTDRAVASAKAEIITYITKITNAWNYYDHSGGTDKSEIFSDEEYRKQAEALEKVRSEFIYYRDTIPDYDGFAVPLILTLVMDENGIEVESQDVIVNNLLDVSVERGVAYGKSYWNVNTQKLNPSNTYMYKVTDIIPGYGSSILGKNFIDWDGISEVELEDNVTVVLVEVSSDKIVKRYKRFKNKSRTDAPDDELAVLKVTSAKSAQIGYTELLVLPEPEEGNVYMYKKATTVPNYNSILPEGYQLWNGESALQLEDNKVYAVVECTADYHRALKFGLVTIDLNANTIKRIKIFSEYGPSPMGSNISTLVGADAGNRILYKIGADFEYPLFGKVIDDTQFSVWSGSGEILFNTFTDKLYMVEVNNEDRVQKAGILSKININNELPCTLSYIDYMYLNNLITYSNYNEYTTTFYKIFNVADVIDDLHYGDSIPEGYEEVFDNIIVIEENKKVAIIEADNNKVVRFAIKNPDIKYAYEIEFDVSNVVGEDSQTIEINNITGIDTVMLLNDFGIDPETLSYYVQTMSVDDGKSYILNEPVSIGNFMNWDGSSIISIPNTDPIAMVRIVIVTTSLTALYAGVEEVS